MSTMDIAQPTSQVQISPKVRLLRLGSTILPFAVLLAVWYLISTLGLIPANWLPTPYKVVVAGVELIGDGRFFNHVISSLSRVVVGFAFSATMGISLGVVMGLRRGFADFIEPLASFLNALSGLAWIPLAITWFGLGPTAVTFILWNSIFFLVLLNTLVGVKSVPRIFEHAVLTLGGGRRQIIFQVLLPGAMPNVVTGIRMGVGFGWRALIAAEMIATTSGLGFMIFDASYYHRSDVILLGILTIGIIWMATDRLLLVPLERWTIERWGMVSKL